MSEVTNGQNINNRKDETKISSNESRDTALENDLKTLRSSPVFHNLLGYGPSECVYVLTIGDLEKDIENMAKRYLDDIQFVTIEIVPNSGRPIAYVWLRNDSKHLVDKKTEKDQNMVFNPRIMQFSQQIKDFADNFAPDTDDNGNKIDRSRRLKLLNPKTGNNNFVAIRVDINRFIQRMFDAKNFDFRDVYSRNNTNHSVRPCGIKCKMLYHTKEGPYSRKNCNGIRITKYYLDSRANGYGMDRPIIGFNDRNSSKEDRINRFDDGDED